MGSDLKDYIQFEGRGNGEIVFVRPHDVSAVGSGCEDNSQTELFIKGIAAHRVIVKGHPLDTVKRLEKFTAQMFEQSFSKEMEGSNG